MEAGRLRHRVTIQSPSDTVNGAGETVRAWSSLATVHAEVRPVSAKDQLRNEAIESDTTHVIRCRYIAGVSSKCRILFGSRVFEIDGNPINPEERNVELHLMCHEVSG